ncbi:hypothetical protein [Gluconobacter albidus]|uniref:HEPN AbiU2-like domain-containing protein n=1 Tax=Gluconobacter albidus TaxID=318683 RepID=A0ABQ5WYM9_9PROT|nr:hypothetical protein [Gluconobacter albidus]GBQ91147.1 hypothetical protein AA3250_2213 [Gluconobacter albidus NBRC 3250]GLQ68079.1 hypothetical protein GCM10007866_05270 [Gluconobacter albidus]
MIENEHLQTYNEVLDCYIKYIFVHDWFFNNSKKFYAGNFDDLTVLLKQENRILNDLVCYKLDILKTFHIEKFDLQGCRFGFENFYNSETIFNFFIYLNIMHYWKTPQIDGIWGSSYNGIIERKSIIINSVKSISDEELKKRYDQKVRRYEILKYVVKEAYDTICTSENIIDYINFNQNVNHNFLKIEFNEHILCISDDIGFQAILDFAKYAKAELSYTIIDIFFRQGKTDKIIPELSRVIKI